MLEFAGFTLSQHILIHSSQKLVMRFNKNMYERDW